MKNRMRWILPLLLLFGSGATLIAQSINAGDIRGSVTDPTGALIPDVLVSVMNVDTGVSKDFTTNQSGLYDTNSIVPGHYTVTFTKDGFEQLVRGPITLEVGYTTVNGQLKVGSMKEQVTVTTDVPLLKTETGEQSTVMNAKTMDELPQVTQDWENFVLLLPGASGTGTTSGANPGQIASVNGNLPYSNILADGASTTLPSSMNANPSTFENVSELQINTSAFSAQYGIGGVIFNQITKGGTSSYHGTAYDFIQNNVLAATSYSFGAGIVPQLRYNNVGGSFGGPVPKLKRMFVYFNYDRIINHGAASVNTSSVPDTNILSGNFNEIAAKLYDPTTQTIEYDVNGNPYPVRKSFAEEYPALGNAIPSAMIDKVVAGVTKFWPTPSSHIPGRFLQGQTGSHGEPINNWASALPGIYPVMRYFGRLDYDITKNNRITMSDTQSDTPGIGLNAIAACPIGCESQDVDNNNAQVTDVWTISPHVVNEARMGYTWQGNFFGDAALGKGYASKLGWQFAKADDFPELNFTDGDWSYAWLDPSANAVYKEHVFDPSDVVTLIAGKHILHFGGEVLIYDDNSTAWGNTTAGTFDFGSPGWGVNHNYTAHWTNDPVKGASIDGDTGWAYADYLLGYASSWSAGVTPEYAGRLKSPQFFVQDDYKISPTLTLNLGLRYQLTHGWGETHGNLDSFDPTVMNPATNTLGAEWYGSTHANGRHNLQEDVNNIFLPRVGFSWLHDPRTTLRGGFGVYAYNMSLDTYGGGMGGPFGSSGNANDTSGISPIVKVDGAGTEIQPGPKGYTGIGITTSTPLPYSAASTDPARFNGQGVGYTAYHTPVPRILQWNFAAQRELVPGMVMELSYVASHAFNLVFPTNLNQIPESQLLSTGINKKAIPYPQYGTNTISGSTLNAVSNYNSLQVQISKRMSSGLSFNFNYVWSHFLDSQDSSGWGSREGPSNYQNAYNPSKNYGNSNFDVRNAFKGNIVYQLPFGKGKPFLNQNTAVDEIVGGWQIAGTIVLATGNPFNLAGTQSTNANGSGQFPNRNPGIPLYAPHKNIYTWYNPEAFTRPLDGTFGNVQRNMLYGPGLEVVNLSAHKDFLLLKVLEHDINFQFRADASNAFNHASFGPPNSNLSGDSGPGTAYTSTNGGSKQIGSITEGGRDIQIGLRLTF